MGGLVENIDNFANPRNGITSGSEGANAHIMSHCLEAADRHGVPINQDVQIEIASEVGIDIADFFKAIRSGETEQKFKADMAITQSSGVRSFPCFLIKTSEGRQLIIRGHQTFAEFQEIISYLTDGSLKLTEVN